MNEVQQFVTDALSRIVAVSKMQGGDAAQQQLNQISESIAKMSKDDITAINKELKDNVGATTEGTLTNDAINQLIQNTDDMLAPGENTGAGGNGNKLGNLMADDRVKYVFYGAIGAGSGLLIGHIAGMTGPQKTALVLLTTFAGLAITWSVLHNAPESEHGATGAWNEGGCEKIGKCASPSGSWCITCPKKLKGKNGSSNS